MPWSAPVDPVAGTVITVTWAHANVVQPLQWLRLMTGNADPPGTGYVVGSDSVGATSWKTIPTILGYQPMNPAVPTTIADLTVARGATPVGIVFLGQTAGNVWVGYTGPGGNIQLQGAPVLIPSNLTVQGTGVINGATTITNDLTIYRAASPTVGALKLGAGGHELAWDGVRFVVDAQPIIHGGNIGSQSVAFATNATNATQVGSRTPTATPSANSIPIADATGKLDAWVTPSGLAGVPSGLICGFAGGAAAIPSGWTRYNEANGRLLVGAGTFSGSEHAFAENNTYGATWAHQHVSNSLPFSVNLSGGSALSVSGSATMPGLGGPSSTGTGGGTGATFADGSHTHAPSGSGSISGTATGTVSGSALGPTTSTTLLPPMRAIVWIVKS